MGKHWRVAIASLDGKMINDHFGRAKEFYIVDIDLEGAYKLFEKRSIAPLCRGGDHSPEAMAATVTALRDCAAVLVSRIGPPAKRMLEISKILVFEQAGMIDDALKKLAKYFITTNKALSED